MKTVLLPSGQTCRPRKLRGIYRGIREFRSYAMSYNLTRRISPNEDTKTLWARNPYIVSSVVPSDLSEYDPKKHPAITRRT